MLRDIGIGIFSFRTIDAVDMIRMRRLVVVWPIEEHHGRPKIPEQMAFPFYDTTRKAWAGKVCGEG